jgi:hypothetical protein
MGIKGTVSMVSVRSPVGMMGTMGIERREKEVATQRFTGRSMSTIESSRGASNNNHLRQYGLLCRS